MKRSAGVLCPLFSLNGEFGIGQMGKQAFDFIDFLADCGYSYWQLLPTNPVGAGNSPYSSPSAFAGYFAFIDPLKVVEWGLANPVRLPALIQQSPNKVDYGSMEMLMLDFLKKAYSQFFSKANRKLLSEYDLFSSKNSSWLTPYAQYAAIKENYEGKAWYEWPEEFKYYQQASITGLEEKMEFYKFTQFLFHKQWDELKNYAETKNIKLIGDMPIYISYDSADVWSQPELFQLNEDLTKQNVAGVPPDFFAEDGQLWGFPLYDWENHEKTNFQWWKNRYDHLRGMFDYVRFDHFRGIEAYWSVPASHQTAKNGTWEKAPGKQLLEAIYPHGSQGMIAENLGDISEEVEQLRKEFHIPGMKIFQFAFGGNVLSEHLPHFAETNDIYYSGTHDNDTLSAWLHNASEEQKKHLEKYFGVKHEIINTQWLIDRILASGVKLCIFPLQDLLYLGTECRTNLPGSVSDANWSWRFTKKELSKIEPKKIHENLYFFGRLS